MSIKFCDFTCVFVFYLNYPACELHLFTIYFLRSSMACLTVSFVSVSNSQTAGFNLLKPTGHLMHQQFNIQQPYVLPTLYLYDLYLSENKQRLVPLTA
jgi:hypothetical protein